MRIRVAGGFVPVKNVLPHDEVALQERDYERLPCLHIGYAKCASTTLQHHFFRSHSEITNLGRPSPHRDIRQTFEVIFNAAEASHNEAAKADVERCRVAWRDQLNLAASAGKIVAYSHERLTHSQYYKTPSDTTLPELLRSIIGPCKIMIVIREQLHVLESYYLHKTRAHTYLPPDEWLETNAAGLVQMLQYDKLASAYRNVFGPENVGIFLFEELRDRPADFANRICRFMGVDPKIGAELLKDKRENIRRSSRMLWYASIRSRLWSHFRVSEYLPDAVVTGWNHFLQRGRRAEVSFSEDRVRTLEKLYAAANSNLIREFDLPLKQFGYL